LISDPAVMELQSASSSSSCSSSSSVVAAVVVALFSLVLAFDAAVLLPAVFVCAGLWFCLLECLLTLEHRFRQHDVSESDESKDGMDDIEKLLCDEDS